jgi:hypothetical protein
MKKSKEVLKQLIEQLELGNTLSSKQDKQKDHAHALRSSEDNTDKNTDKTTIN